jgi:hypothetical protein
VVVCFVDIGRIVDHHCFNFFSRFGTATHSLTLHLFIEVPALKTGG